MIKSISVTKAAAVLAVLVFCQAVSAGFIEDELGKSEADAAKQFEEELPKVLKNALTDKSKPKPQMYLKLSKKDIPLVQFVSEKDGEYTWEELARGGWSAPVDSYSYFPYWGKKHKKKLKDIDPAEIANLLDVRYYTTKSMLRLACWLYINGADDKANAFMGELAEKNEKQRQDIEAWVCEKQGWKLPENGLILRNTFDFRSIRSSRMLITQDALDSLKKSREKQGSVRFKLLQEDVGSVKGKPGLRKISPKVRLEILKRQLDEFEVMYGDLEVVKKKSNKKKLDAMKLKVEADLKYIEEQTLVCERMDSDAGLDVIELTVPAIAWRQLLRSDPNNDTLLKKTAAAQLKAAGITRVAGIKSKAVAVEFAALAAYSYTKLVEFHPSWLAYRNYAGSANMALGSKGEKIAKEHFRFVVSTVNRIKSPTEGDNKNKEYAESMLKK